MLELNAAASTSAIAAATPAPDAADAAAPAGTDSAASPFANVLQNHIKQPQDAKETKTEARTAAADAAPAVATQVPVDALAVLAPMLAGLVPAQTAATAVATDDTVAAASPASGDAPIAIAAPVLPGVVSTAVQTAATTAEPAARQATPIDADARPAVLPQEAQQDPAEAGGRESQPGAAKTAEPPSAILAAAPSSEERAAETGKSHAPADSFASLLDAAQGSQMMATHGATHRAAASAAPTAGTAVTTPVGAPGWGNEVGEKVSWMVSRQESRAELVLNPPQLGRIEVSLSLNGDQANAVFVAANPTVREALENAMPRLREILQDAGISLGQTQVGAESFQQASSGENGDNAARNGAGNGGPAIRGSAFVPVGTSQAPWLRQGNGLIDTFA